MSPSARPSMVVGATGCLLGPERHDGDVDPGLLRLVEHGAEVLQLLGPDRHEQLFAGAGHDVRGGPSTPPARRDCGRDAPAAARPPTPAPPPASRLRRQSRVAGGRAATAAAKEGNHFGGHPRPPGQSPPRRLSPRRPRPARPAWPMSRTPCCAASGELGHLVPVQRAASRDQGHVGPRLVTRHAEVLQLGDDAPDGHPDRAYVG